jgi:misacylated tRNA(Ala) deacylase
MDFDLPELPPDFRDHVEDACNAEIRADRRIDVRVLPREEAFAIPDIIRTATNLIPDSVTDVRIVDIAGLDTQVLALARPAAAGATSRTALLPRTELRLTRG